MAVNNETAADLDPAAPSEGEDADVRPVADVVSTLAKTLRAHRLYQGEGPSYERFMNLLRDKLSDLWEDGAPDLCLEVRDDRLATRGCEVYREERRSDSLAFMLHRDGLREITLYPGIETEEMGRLVAILNRVHALAGDSEDDLVTLLWDQDLSYLRYRYVDTLGDGTDLPEQGGYSAPDTVDTESVQAEADAAPEGVVSTDSFQESLHFLEIPELRALRAEIDREMRRPVWRDVLNALFDRLEDASPQRTVEITEVLVHVLPAVLARGDMALAAETAAVLALNGGLSAEVPPAVRALVRSTFRTLAEREPIEQLVTTLEDSPNPPDPEALAAFLAHLPAEAMEVLLPRQNSTVRTEVREGLTSGVRMLAERHPHETHRLLTHADPSVLCPAVRLAVRVGGREVAGAVAKLLHHRSPDVRRSAIDALGELGSGEAGDALMEALEDRDREVRIAAARTLQALRFAPAREPLRALTTSRKVRERDLTERIALFEAYGSLAGADAVAELGELLNGRGWLGRRHAAEHRACAALALGRLGHASARTALESAARDADPVVRNAVSRALRARTS